MGWRASTPTRAVRSIRAFNLTGILGHFGRAEAPGPKAGGLSAPAESVQVAFLAQPGVAVHGPQVPAPWAFLQRVKPFDFLGEPLQRTENVT